jgi:hypothetical protein
MDHGYIDEHGVVSAYVAGKLSPAERMGFEEHFVGCRRCLEQIEVTAELREGLRQVAKEDSVRAGVARLDVARLGGAPQVAPALWAGGGFWKRAGFLAYAMVAVLGLAAIFFVDGRYQRSEVAEARRASEDWQRRYVEERQARESLEKEIAEVAEIDREHGDVQGPLASLQPAPLFFLNVARGTDEGSAPANRVAVSPGVPLIALSLEFEKDPVFRSYRARVSDAAGRVLWSAENIPSPASDAIAITLPSHLLGRGNYSVVLEGRTAGGRYLPAARFAFQASLQK